MSSVKSNNSGRKIIKWTLVIFALVYSFTFLSISISAFRGARIVRWGFDFIVTTSNRSLTDCEVIGTLDDTFLGDFGRMMGRPLTELGIQRVDVVNTDYVRAYTYFNIPVGIYTAHKGGETFLSRCYYISN